MSGSTPQDEFHRLVAGLRSWVEAMKDSGLDAFPGEPRMEAPAASGSTEGDPGTATDDRRTILETAAAALHAVREELGDCRRCRLCGNRTNLVFGVGSPVAEVMFIGEGPGEDEDQKGEPFVGRAGRLLTDIITSGMGLRRSDVYIANVVKCRPPGNRNPEPDEIDACAPFLAGQIESIQPKVIVALGKFAAQTLLETTTPISKLRGRWHAYRGRKLMPTFHPSYLLRNPADKKLVWSDIQLVMKELGLPLPTRPRRATPEP